MRGETQCLFVVLIIRLHSHYLEYGSACFLSPFRITAQVGEIPTSTLRPLKNERRTNEENTMAPQFTFTIVYSVIWLSLQESCQAQPFYYVIFMHLPINLNYASQDLLFKNVYRGALCYPQLSKMLAQYYMILQDARITYSVGRFPVIYHLQPPFVS